jgi:hypothetical protein
VFSGAPQGSTTGTLLFNIFINDFWIKINYSKFLLCADDLKIYRDMKSVEDCKSLQADIYSVQQWCFENSMELNIHKNKIKSFIRKSNSIHLIITSVMF